MQSGSRGIFYLGKGGAGKTTIAALTALALSQKQYDVALISMDPAHNLFDIFQITPSETYTDLSSHLRLEEINPAFWLKKYLETVEAQISRSYQYLTSLGLEKNFQILQFAPGLEEYALLYAYQTIKEKYAAYDFLIIDMPPTALALRFFALPQLSRLWLQQLLNLRKTILEKTKIIENIQQKSAEEIPDRVLQKLISLHEQNEKIQSEFAQASRTGLYVVLNNDSLSVAESLDICDKFNIAGLEISGFILNKATSLNAELKSRHSFNQPFLFTLDNAEQPPVGLQTLTEMTKGVDFEGYLSALLHHPGKSPD